VATPDNGRERSADLDERTVTVEVAVSGLDPFSTGFLRDPYPAHEQLREAGPVVRLERYGAWATARYAQVRTALDDWATFRSGAGIGLTDFTKEKPWRRPSLLLETDPPEHSRARRAIDAALSTKRVRSLHERFEQEADALVARLVARERFDAVEDLAEAFPIEVFGDAVGVPHEGRRESLMAYGDMVFNAVGPRNRFFEESARGLDEPREWVAEMCRKENLRPGGLGAAVHEHALQAGLGADDGALLVRSLLSAGVDTAVSALGNAIWCFAAHPDQWAALRTNPNRTRAAFEEVLRFESPVQGGFRTTTREVDLGGVRIPEGEKVLLVIAAANRDPRRWDDPERFDICRTASGHLGFGRGIHACVGRMLARLEGQALLDAMVRRVETIELAGEPQRKLNNALRGFAKLPIRVRAAQG
jgi:4-methoxybenzoate monooxygenase (O-demethylating)